MRNIFVAENQMIRRRQSAGKKKMWRKSVCRLPAAIFPLSFVRARFYGILFFMFLREGNTFSRLIKRKSNQKRDSAADSTTCAY